MHITACRIRLVKKNLKKALNKQGFVEDYTQRLKEENIVRQKLSRLKFSRLRSRKLHFFMQDKSCYKLANNYVL